MHKLLAALLVVFFVAVPAFAESDDISRLYTFSAGTTIQSSQMNGEFNQIISTVNEKAGRSVDQTLTGVNTFSGNNIHSGNNSFTGINTFSHASSPIKTDFLLENTPGGGVTIDSVTLKDGYINIDVEGSDDPSSPVDGDIWYDSTTNTFQGRANGATVDIQTASTEAAFPTKHIQGALVEYATNATATIATGKVRDVADSHNIAITSARTCNVTTSGAGGLDTGSEANSTFYYVYIIDDSAGVSTEACLLSTTNESVSGSVTMPSGYDKKRQLPIAIRNDSGGAFIPWVVSTGWPNRPEVYYRVNTSRLNSGGTIDAGTLNVLTAGTSGTFADVDLSSFVPPLARRAILATHNSTTVCYASVREDATNSQEIGITMGSVYSSAGTFNVPVDSAQAIDYKINFGSGSLYLDVYGYVVTEI